MLAAFPTEGPFVDGAGNAVSNAQWIFKPDLSSVAGLPPRYWNILVDVVLPMTQSERDAVDAAIAAGIRDAIASDVDRSHPSILRAFAELLVDELNDHSAKINAILDAADNATSLASFKTAMLSISDHPTRSLPQLKNAIRGKLDG